MSKKKRIEQCFNELDRRYFMERDKEHAAIDAPFPIGYGQTISQPSLVLDMTVLLNPDRTSKVLEIGTGSGFQTALLASVSKLVFSVERIRALQLKAQARLEKKGYTNIKYKVGDGHLGWEAHAPFDKIMVTAAASFLPDRLLAQLAPHGNMVIPVGPGPLQDLLHVTKDGDGRIEKQAVGRVSFVRLIGDQDGKN